MNKLFICSVLFSSCSDNVDLVIDNPTTSAIEITVDTLRFIVPPKEMVWLEIGKGEHQLTLENDSIIMFNFTESVYMINPSLSEYLVSDEYYGPEMYSDNFTSKIPKKEVIFLGISMVGNYEVILDVITTVTWDYGPRETLPEKVEVDEDKLYTGLVKVYDPIEFMDMMQSKIIDSSFF